MAVTLHARIKLRADNTANWTANNPTLAERELGIETDGAVGPDGTTWRKAKMGPGQWSTLPYISFGDPVAMQAALNALITAHEGDTDPHGDRAYTDTKIAQEVTDRNAAIAAALVGLWDDRGNFDASGADAYPTTGGSGTGGAILKGDVWTVSVAGHGLDMGDTVRALVDSPGLTAANWAAGEANVQQATETTRGTAMIARSSEADDSSTTNDTDIVTPVKMWHAWGISLTLTAFFNAVRGVQLDGLNVTTDAVIADSDSILGAAGKLQGQITAFRSKLQITTSSASSYTITAANVGNDKLLERTSATASTTTIPNDTTEDLPIGSVVCCIQGGDGKDTVTPMSGVTFIALDNALTSAGKGAPYMMVKRAANTWYVTGTLMP